MAFHNNFKEIIGLLTNYSIISPLSQKIFYTFANKLNALNMETKVLNRIKVVLVEKRRTGVWLAEQLGVSPVTISKWCSNTTQPTIQTLDKIAELLEVDKRDLLTSNRN